MIIAVAVEMMDIERLVAFVMAELVVAMEEMMSDGDVWDELDGSRLVSWLAKKTMMMVPLEPTAMGDAVKT